MQKKRSPKKTKEVSKKWPIEGIFLNQLVALIKKKRATKSDKERHKKRPVE